MKKFLLTTILCLFLLCNTTVPVSADFSVLTGYTDDGIFYEAVTLEYSSSAEPLADTDIITVTKEVTFSGIITPNDTLAWRELIDDTVYVGTLRLYSYYHFDGRTIAIYKGTLYAEYSYNR
jgi:hypothetical protein